MNDVVPPMLINKQPVTGALKAVIFDCDGVLVDSEPVYAEAFSQTLAEFGCDLPASLLEKTLHGKSMADCYKWLAKYWQFTVTAQFEKQLFANTDALIPQLLKPIEGAPRVVRAVCAPKAVASNGVRRSVMTNLDFCDLSHFFEGQVYTASQVARPKPAPDVYLLAAKSLEVAPDLCAVIEDSALGVQAAVIAGMQVCWLISGDECDTPVLEGLSASLSANVYRADSMAKVHQWLVAKGLACDESL